MYVDDGWVQLLLHQHLINHIDIGVRVKKPLLKIFVVWHNELAFRTCWVKSIKTTCWMEFASVFSKVPFSRQLKNPKETKHVLLLRIHFVQHLVAHICSPTKNTKETNKSSSPRYPVSVTNVHLFSPMKFAFSRNNFVFFLHIYLQRGPI